MYHFDLKCVKFSLNHFVSICTVIEFSVFLKELEKFRKKFGTKFVPCRFVSITLDPKQNGSKNAGDYNFVPYMLTTNVGPGLTVNFFWTDHIFLLLA